jgi:endonuclease/exonuclease/phosphatase family metal-dependent hydrolase
MNTFLSKLLIITTLAVASVAVVDARTLMTFNLRRADGKEKSLERHWNNRKAVAADIVVEHNADIIGFQEPTHNQIQEFSGALQQRCPEYGLAPYACRKSVYCGLDAAECNPIMYKRTKFEIIESGTFEINKPWYKMLTNYKATALLPRICTYVLFKDKQSNEFFYVYNTHLDHRNDKARLYGLRKILRHIRKKNKSKSPVILMGDFNVDIRPPFTGELNRHGFVDTKSKAKKHVGPAVTHKSWSASKRPALNCDHILVANMNNKEVSQHTVVQNDIASDHYAVVVSMQ